MDGTGGAEGAQAPPSFLDLYSKNFKIYQIRDENFFFYLVVPPHKKFASVHPGLWSFSMSKKDQMNILINNKISAT